MKGGNSSGASSICSAWLGRPLWATLKPRSYWPVGSELGGKTVPPHRHRLRSVPPLSGQLALGRTRGEGHPHPKGGPPPHLALHTHPPPKHLQPPLHQIQPQPRSPILPPRRAIHLHEGLEDDRSHFRRHPNPRIADTTLYPVLLRTYHHRNPAVRRKLHRITEHVLQNRLEFAPLGAQPGQRGCHLPLKVQRRLSRCQLRLLLELLY